MTKNPDQIVCVDPATRAPLGSVRVDSPADVDAAVARAKAAQKSWARTSFAERRRVLGALLAWTVEHKEDICAEVQRGSGKTRENALLGEIWPVCEKLRWTIGNGEKHLRPEKVSSGLLAHKTARLEYHPLGVVAAIIPWNSPLFLATWKMAPALAAGNTMVIKPSEYTSASLLEFMKLVEQAGIPPGVVNVVTGFGSEAGLPLVEHPLVAKVAFTGSDLTGQKVYEAAARNLKRVSMELGGKSPNIVFDDAEMDNAVKGVVSGIFAATGQTCVAGSRLLVQQSIHDRFVEKLLALAKTAKMGNPMDFGTQVGPITNKPQLEKVLNYIDIAKSEGASPLIGGKRPSSPECGDGWFVEPTIFGGVKNSMRIAQEEVFGPVLSIIPFRDEEEAVAIGNDIVYGLAAGVWTQNMRRALTMADRLRAGTVWINTYRAVSYLSPFGGYKRSGIGRENGQEMLKEYLQVKSVWISTASEVPNPFVQR